MRSYLLVALLVSAAVPRSDASPSARRNHELFTRLGLQRVRAPNSHHRKRLAVESRHHTRSDDSHMFIIKLPPHPHYYAHNAVETAPGKNIPVSFKSNGKPAKVYHWNMPLIEKVVKQKARDGGAAAAAAVDVGGPNGWNEVLEKPERERKPTKPTYYVPAQAKRAPFKKYFPGNGKLHSFYVIESSNKAHYHRLLP